MYWELSVLQFVFVLYWELSVLQFVFCTVILRNLGITTNTTYYIYRYYSTTYTSIILPYFHTSIILPLHVGYTGKAQMPFYICIRLFQSDEPNAGWLA